RLGDPTVGGPQAVRDMLVQLQGFEMSAAAWERQVLGPRIAQYDPRWLDELFLAGEATWGRLRPPQREAKEATEVPALANKKRSRSATIEDAETRQLSSGKAPSETGPSDNAPSEESREEPRWAAMTRAMPMSIVLREELPWLLPVERTDLSGQLRPDAARVLSTIRNRGALFVAELRMLTGLSLERLDDALGELAAVGLVTSDAFAAVRAMVARRRDAARRASTGGAEPRDEASATDAGTRPSGGSLDWRRGPTGLATGGRWSQFPGVWGSSAAEEPVAEEIDSQRGATDARPPSSNSQGPSRIERWCWQLLRRYGVVFRDVLTRESAAPSWHELVPTFRRMELRGEIRGGRFVSGVSGEQYATESAVTALRQVRDSAPGDWLLVSASDPLNLSGIIVPGPRIPAVHKNALILAAGRCVAARKGGKIEFFVDDLDPQVKAEMTLALHHLRRRQVPAKPPITAPAICVPPPTQAPPPPPAPRPPDKVRQIRDRWSSF
ncbi:MAG TPA: hypothetical protein PLV92_22225, partial [Pirellulaceae bacterium]|nr:hypothetical protein [Pirellulaceae bacterium]